MMLKKGVSTQRRMFLSPSTALISSSGQAAAWRKNAVVVFVVFWRKEKNASMDN